MPGRVEIFHDRKLSSRTPRRATPTPQSPRENSCLKALFFLIDLDTLEEADLTNPILPFARQTIQFHFNSEITDVEFRAEDDPLESEKLPHVISYYFRSVEYL